MNKIKPFDKFLNTFETDEMREYCKDMINMIPDYIFKIPSSTSLKYHNKTQCQPGGQLYHILMTCEIMNYILGLEYIKAKWDKPKQRDCFRVAICLHDSIKCGLNATETSYSIHEHPIETQKWILNTNVEHDIDYKLKKYIGRLVASHSGEWIKSNRSQVVLPKIENDEQFLVHLCDYLGSRSNIDMIYSDDEINAIADNQNSIIMPFGKYKGENIKDIPMDYLEWCLNNMDISNPILKNGIEKLVEEHR